MARVFEVKVPKSATPTFPASCVACGAPPTTTVKIAEGSQGWWTFLPHTSLYSDATGSSVQVPACAACARRFRRSRLLRRGVLYALITAVSAIGWRFFDEWHWLARWYALMGLGLVAALPWIAWETLFPLAVDITVTDEWVKFQFTNREFADRFAAENGALP